MYTTMVVVEPQDRAQGGSQEGIDSGTSGVRRLATMCRANVAYSSFVSRPEWVGATSLGLRAGFESSRAPCSAGDAIGGTASIVAPKRPARCRGRARRFSRVAATVSSLRSLLAASVAAPSAP
jgi:hypothetical protein